MWKRPKKELAEFGPDLWILRCFTASIDLEGENESNGFGAKISLPLLSDFTRHRQGCLVSYSFETDYLKTIAHYHRVHNQNLHFYSLIQSVYVTKSQHMGQLSRWKKKHLTVRPCNATLFTPVSDSECCCRGGIEWACGSGESVYWRSFSFVRSPAPSLSLSPFCFCADRLKAFHCATTAQKLNWGHISSLRRCDVRFSQSV